MEKIAIHEIPGFSFGQVQDLEGGTGCTVILCPEGAVTGVDVRGGSPGLSLIHICRCRRSYACR